MYNAAIRALGLDAAYVALHTPAKALPTVLEALAAVAAAGNVTVPHKEATERYVARKTGLCARVGACNTFWTEHGALVGDNTDVPGVRAALHALGGGGGGGGGPPPAPAGGGAPRGGAGGGGRRPRRPPPRGGAGRPPPPRPRRARAPRGA